MIEILLEDGTILVEASHYDDTFVVETLATTGRAMHMVMLSMQTGVTSRFTIHDVQQDWRLRVDLFRMMVRTEALRILPAVESAITERLYDEATQS